LNIDFPFYGRIPKSLLYKNYTFKNACLKINRLLNNFTKAYIGTLTANARSPPQRATR